MSQKQCTKAQLVDCFGESAKQLERYVQEGMPCIGSGRARRFPWPEVRNWRDERVRRLEREAAERKFKPIDFGEAKTRKMAAEAELAELDIAERRGELIDVEDAVRALGRVCDVLRAGILAFPGRVAPRAVGLPTIVEAQALLDEETRALLEALSTVDIGPPDVPRVRCVGDPGRTSHIRDIPLSI